MNVLAVCDARHLTTARPLPVSIRERSSVLADIVKYAENIYALSSAVSYYDGYRCARLSGL
jgi:6-phosphogluconate dehydrogenase